MQPLKAAGGRLRFTPELAEALAFHLYRAYEFSSVPEVCSLWAEADQFSIRPYEFGATTAGFIEAYDQAIDLARKGLRLRPGAPVLVSSPAFALASSNRATEAEEVLRQLGPN